MSSISAIELHVRTYRSALKSNQEVAINSLKNTYVKMEPLLSSLDALTYSLARLPPQIDQTKTIIIGQRPEVFAKAGFTDVRSWPQVSSPARRRTVHFDKKTHTLAVFTASITDVDDMVNLLLAYQIETNKIHRLSSFSPSPRLKTALGKNWQKRLSLFHRRPTDLRLRLLAGSWNDYAKTTQRWWKNIARTTDPKIHMSRQTIYFVSSNTYSLANLINNPKAIVSIPSAHYLDINTQIIPVKSLAKSKNLDPQIKIKKPQKLAQSDTLIFNIDYPLGFAAHHILTEVLQNVIKVKGIYIMGKSAVLNGAVGDIQIPKIVFDEHSQNTYLFKNCFNQFFPFKHPHGSIIANQKAVSVLGTFLENQALINKYSKNDFTIIEMESGPYLSAISQSTYDQVTPKNTIIDLNPAPFDIGIINYTSDTPYSKTKNLGSPQDSQLLKKPIRLASLAILQRIINLEENT